MAKDSYPELDLGREGGVAPSRLRISGRNIVVVGALIDAGVATFDNGVMTSKSRAEAGIVFGPEPLRALGGRRVLALWFAAVKDAEGHNGWFGLSVGEMRIDAAKKEGFRDLNSFQVKLTEASQGRTAIWQLKDPEKKALVALLSTQPDLWIHAVTSFRNTIKTSIPELQALDAPAGTEKRAADVGSPQIDLGAQAGSAPRSFRTNGRDLTILGILVEGGKAEWDNGILESKSRVEQGIVFGPEALRAMGGKRFCSVWISVARQEDGSPGYFGATVSDMRVDPAKKEGFRDMAAHAMKLNNAARGRVELSRLKPEERAAVAALLQGRTDLWESCFENVRSALG